MSYEALQRHAMALCLGPPPTAQRLGALRSQPDRWRLYRDMVQGRLLEMIAAALPRSRARAGSGLFDAGALAWLAEVGPSSPFIRDVPTAFGAWWSERPIAARGSALRSLLDWELAVWTAGFDPAPFPPAAGLRFDAAPVLNPTLQIVRLSHRVHVQEGASDAAEAAVSVAVLRDPRTHEVRWRELDELGERFLSIALARPAPMTDAWREAAGRDLDEGVVSAIVDLLTAWQGDGLLLGSHV
jgi:hypothetical protein